MSDELDLLLDDGVIDEVLGRLKSGKEANISLVRRGEDVIAAKVYKDRATRSFKNNAEYKEGRKVRNTRTQRAMDTGGKFGRDAAEEAWKSAEADALGKLQGSGVRVPAPILFYEGVLLMDLVRDAEGRPAPRMIDVAIPREAALGVYADLCAQMIAMLCCDLIHGDLSPYNILAAAEGPTIIDFPQVISAVHNSRAEHYFLRDFDNVVRFISGFDPALAVHRADGRAIWRAYVGRELTPQFVPPPPPPPRPTRGPDRRGPSDRGPRGDGRYAQRPPGGGGGPPRNFANNGGGPPRGGGGPGFAGNGGPPRGNGGGPPRGDYSAGPPRGDFGGGPPRGNPGGGPPRGDFGGGPPRGDFGGGPPRGDFGGGPPRGNPGGGPSRGNPGGGPSRGNPGGGAPRANVGAAPPGGGDGWRRPGPPGAGPPRGPGGPSAGWSERRPSGAGPARGGPPAAARGGRRRPKRRS
jgi:RIO kinase 1